MTDKTETFDPQPFAYVAVNASANVWDALKITLTEDQLTAVNKQIATVQRDAILKAVEKQLSENEETAHRPQDTETVFDSLNTAADIVQSRAKTVERYHRNSWSVTYTSATREVKLVVTDPKSD